FRVDCCDASLSLGSFLMPMLKKIYLQERAPRSSTLVT
ncbi:MAG: hypothetical protein ACI9BC_002442, partial [Crocinitomicaceae bacterium]